MQAYINYYSLFQFYGDESQHNDDQYDTIKWSTHGLIQVVTIFSIYLINNYTYNIKYIDEQRTTQNNDLHIDAIIIYRSSTKDTNWVAKIIAYYGVIKEIILFEFIIVGISIIQM